MVILNLQLIQMYNETTFKIKKKTYCCVSYGLPQRHYTWAIDELKK